MWSSASQVVSNLLTFRDDDSGIDLNYTNDNQISSIATFFDLNDWFCLYVTIKFSTIYVTVSTNVPSTNLCNLRNLCDYEI